MKIHSLLFKGEKKNLINKWVKSHCVCIQCIHVGLNYRLKCDGWSQTSGPEHNVTFL